MTRNGFEDTACAGSRGGVVVTDALSATRSAQYVESVLLPLMDAELEARPGYDDAAEAAAAQVAELKAELKALKESGKNTKDASKKLQKAAKASEDSKIRAANADDLRAICVAMLRPWASHIDCQALVCERLMKWMTQDDARLHDKNTPDTKKRNEFTMAQVSPAHATCPLSI